MKIYIDENDAGKTVTYKEEYGNIQYLYVHDGEGFIFKDLKQYKTDLINAIRQEFDKLHINGSNQKQVSLSRLFKFLDKLEKGEIK